MTPQQQDRVRDFMLQGNVSGPQQGALNRLQSGQNLTDEDRSALTNMLADPKLDSELREIIKQGLQEDSQGKRQQGTKQTQRFLKIRNETNEPILIHFQYRTQRGEDWVWFPADPKKSAESATLQIPPLKEAYAEVDQNRVLSSRVRLWAKSTSKSGTEWLEYKDQDLWLVPEVDKGSPTKEHAYFAPNTQTFTFVFKS
jgi:hypothetical protein